MDTFDLVITLLSFIYAMAIAQLLQGVTDLLLARKRVRFSLAYVLWALLALLIMFGNWLALFVLRTTEWSVQLILLEFLLAATIYFSCSLLVLPKSEDGSIDLVAFVRGNGWLFKAPYYPMVALVLAIQLSFTEYRGGLTNPLAYAEILLTPVLVGISIWRSERWIQIAAPALLIAYFATQLWIG